MSTIPTIFAQDGWYSIAYIAKRLNKSRRTVTYWATNGLFARMGIKVATVPAKGIPGCYMLWVHVPRPSKFAILRNIALDISPTQPPQ